MTLAEVLFWIFAVIACGGGVAVVVSQNVVRMAVWLIFSLGATAGLFFLLDADFVGATQLLIYVGGTLVLLIFGVMLTATGPYVQIRTAPAEGFLAAGVGVLFLAMIVGTVGAIDWNDTALRLNRLADVPQADFEATRADGELTEADARLLDQWYALDETADRPLYRLRRDGEIPRAETERLVRFWETRHRIQPPTAGGGTVRPLGLAFLGLRPDQTAQSGQAAGLGTGYLLPFEIISVHLLVVLVGAAYLARAKRRTEPTGV